MNWNYSPVMSIVTLPAGAATRRAVLNVRAAVVDRLRGAAPGQGMVEYALILMLIAIVIVVILGLLGGHVSHLYSNIANGLPG
jgi:pilus assembly protein Flp/PilA